MKNWLIVKNNLLIYFEQIFDIVKNPKLCLIIFQLNNNNSYN